MPEYTYHITLTSTVRVKANSPKEAESLMRKNIDAADVNFGAWPDGTPIVQTVYMLDDSVLVEIDGEAV